MPPKTPRTSVHVKGKSNGEATNKEMRAALEKQGRKVSANANKDELKNPIREYIISKDEPTIAEMREALKRLSVKSSCNNKAEYKAACKAAKIKFIKGDNTEQEAKHKELEKRGWGTKAKQEAAIQMHNDVNKLLDEGATDSVVLIQGLDISKQVR